MEENKRKNLPAELSFYMDFNWDTKKLWELELPVEDSRLDEWAWHLELPFWSRDDGFPSFNLRPVEVLRDPDCSPRHLERIKNADLSFPLDTYFCNSRWVIIDGLHRLAGHYLHNNRSLRIRRVPESSLKFIII